MKIFARVLCLILACLFCMFALVACKDDPTKDKKKREAEIKTDENGVRWAKDEWGTWREYDDLPDQELDYDASGYSACIFCPSSLDIFSTTCFSCVAEVFPSAPGSFPP